MDTIKFGTDGWRAIIAQSFTVDNVKRVAKATADWLNDNYENPSIVLGYDCRFGGKLFAGATAGVMGANGIKVFYAEGFVSTPMVSLGIVNHSASAGVVITASHNPPDYNGYKIKAHFGGPALMGMIDDVESRIPNELVENSLSLDEMKSQGLFEYVELEKKYCQHIEDNFAMDKIRGSSSSFAYDAMYGAGQNVIKNLLPDLKMVRCEHLPTFKGQAPEPIHRNLGEFSDLIKGTENLASGLATDGDADRIGMYDDQGNFIDSHHIILLLIHYLYKYKEQSGKVITTFSCTQKIAKMCQAYGLEHIITKIGFKYICEYMSKPEENVLMGGEESGGIAISSHIPERDGIWIGLVIWEFMAVTGKTLRELIQEVYDVVGEFKVERSDLHINEELKLAIIDNCNSGVYKSFGDYEIQRVEDMDGFKFHFANDEWVMIRPSGTEPVLRTYAESTTTERAFEILKATESTILNNQSVVA
ncbi:MAG: phosphoglucomutase/phosphomannomutase family protein [Bacteroidia bacterium]|nr:phosphoglucomutase/phosphomannomutase family protein [Bacteroidia bacterium]